MSTQSIVVTFKFKIKYDKQKFKMKKKQAAAAVVNSAVNSVKTNLSKSTILNSNQHHSNSQLHALQLLKQVNTCLENVERAVEFQ